MKNILLILFVTINASEGMQSKEQAIMQKWKEVQTHSARCEELAKAEANVVEIQAEIEKFILSLREVSYLLSEPARNCDTLHAYVSKVLGDDCEIRIVKNPDIFLKAENPTEHARLRKIFLGSPSNYEEMAEEIRTFLNRCEFSSSLQNPANFKFLIESALIKMSTKEVYREQIFSAIAFAKVGDDPNKANKFAKFSESNKGSQAIWGDTSEIKIDFSNTSNTAFNALSDKGVILDETNTSLENILYHEIGHHLNPFVVCGDWEKSIAIAGLGRRLNITLENQPFVIEQFRDYISHISVSGMSKDQYMSYLIEILKDPAKYNAYLFDANLSPVGILDIAQILGFYVMQYQGKWILFLYKSADILRALREGTPIRADHLYQILSLTNQYSLDQQCDSEKNVAILNIQHEIGYIDFAFYQALALALGYDTDEFQRCIMQKK